MAAKKSGPKFSDKASVRVKVRKKHPKRRNKTWMVVGFDISLSSIAGAAFAWDGTLRKFVGPVFVMKSWPPNTHYFEKLQDLVRAENFIHELQLKLKLVAELDEIYIAVEEPFPVGMVKRLESQSIKQQAEFSGAFLGGLLRYGFQNVFQIAWYQWAGIVAEESGITIHHSKWNYTKNPFKLAPHGKGSGKWRVKAWALNFCPWAGEIPKWRDLISREKQGKIPRPKDSKARAVQPDDRYDALGIMYWMKKELEKLGLT